MKVVAVLGSAHENGVSSTIAKEVLRGAADAGHEIVVYDINKISPQGCHGCGFCRKNGVNCVIEDGLKAYWKDLLECGALLLSSPNYYSQIAGPMITFMNRHYCLTDGSGRIRLPAGKKLIGVFAQGNSNAQAYKAQYDWYLGTFLKKGMTSAGMLIHVGETPLESDGELMRRAYQTGSSLLG